MPIKKIDKNTAIKQNRKLFQPSNRHKSQPPNHFQKKSGRASANKNLHTGSKTNENLLKTFYSDSDYGKSLLNKNLTTLLKNGEHFFQIPHSKTFDLVTTYPGLLIGAGYAHPKLKENNDDFQLGFFFDHTTGMPIIPGSSIKGVLRSIAPLDKKDPLYDNKKAYMQAVYDSDEAMIEKFCACFEDQSTVFYDAYPVDTEDSEGRIFADDYITPHGDNLTEEPNPIRFLKIRPGVTFRFQFDAAPKLVELFEQILTDRGIGAKTNVGYGQMVPNKAESGN